MFKSFFCKLTCLLTSFGYARAAATLAREGKYEMAKQVMIAKEENECKC